MITGGLIEVRAPLVMVFLLQLLPAVFYLSVSASFYLGLCKSVLTDLGWLVLSVTKLEKSPTLSVDFVSPFSSNKFPFNSIV